MDANLPNTMIPGEPDARKPASPVRGGEVGKVHPKGETRWPSTLPIAPPAPPMRSIASSDDPVLAFHLNGQQNGNHNTLLLVTAGKERKKAKRRPPPPPRVPLPTFPLEVGWREVFDPVTQKYSQQPLTLLDLLYPGREATGILVMTQGPIHDRWSRRLADTFEAYLAEEDWLVLHDVLIDWNVPGIQPRGPDVAVIHGGRLPAERNESYHVGRDGPVPDFVIEITSTSTRLIDLQDKPLAYATVGVAEFLLIDKGTPPAEPWGLRGYRLGENPTYEEFLPDAQGRISFERIGLQFEVVGRERVNVYDLATGERWLTPEELKQYADAENLRADAETQRADAETQRADAEAAARREAEAQIERERLTRSEVEIELARAKARLRELGIDG